MLAGVYRRHFASFCSAPLGTVVLHYSLCSSTAYTTPCLLLFFSLSPPGLPLCLAWCLFGVNWHAAIRLHLVLSHLGLRPLGIICDAGKHGMLPIRIFGVFVIHVEVASVVRQR